MQQNLGCPILIAFFAVKMKQTDLTPGSRMIKFVLNGFVSSSYAN
jgi:hypothetical protein